MGLLTFAANHRLRLMINRKIIRLNAAPKGFGEVADDLAQIAFQLWWNLFVSHA
jgi:hypothetical protein